MDEINDILAPLDRQSKVVAPHSTELPRFSWAAGYQPDTECTEGQELPSMLVRSRKTLAFVPSTCPRKSVCVMSRTDSSSRTIPGDVQSTTQARRADRDQRSELKRLQQTLLTSGQQTFDQEIWEGCGIEGEHIKRQQLAQMLGLSFNLNAKKEEVDNFLSARSENEEVNVRYERLQVTRPVGAAMSDGWYRREALWIAASDQPSHSKR